MTIAIDMRQKQFETMLMELAQFSGAQERTAIYPGAEVINAAFDTNRIIVKGRQGYYEPAVTAGGASYSVVSNVYEYITAIN